MNLGIGASRELQAVPFHPLVSRVAHSSQARHTASGKSGTLIDVGVNHQATTLAQGSFLKIRGIRPHPIRFSRLTTAWRAMVDMMVPRPSALRVEAGNQRPSDDGRCRSDQLA
jgi:hypothetical protein